MLAEPSSCDGGAVGAPPPRAGGGGAHSVPSLRRGRPLTDRPSQSRVRSHHAADVRALAACDGAVSLGMGFAVLPDQSSQGESAASGARPRVGLEE
ncbi:hypothetical protein EVAR_61672_1 [Eumeta japonica]|uniref:Uncharacterized protein n=1 Tax=Eumeta variegata TaxID=151549 RepID=A0A4C1YTN1_EUMVA|nr:hypothetical protein EVAR_61672_1 [Eumeta japonica]